MRIIKLVLLIIIFTFSVSACATPQTKTPDAMPLATSVQPTNTIVPTNTVESTQVPATGNNPVDGTEYVLVPENSKANYRVTEQLASRDLPSDAVGVTNGISGSIKLLSDGTIDQASSKFTVDLSQLTSDSSMRDNYVRRNILQTSQFPEAVFVPKEIKGLAAPIPMSGDVTFQVIGDLTIRDVTKQVTWDVTGTIANGEATGKATTTFTFADFNLNQPKVPVVLSLEDKITLEVEVALKPAGM